MGSLAHLLDASNELVRSRAGCARRPDAGGKLLTDPAVNDILVPLAALAFQSSQAIPGLSDCLRRHGWNGYAFEQPIDLQTFTDELWHIYHTTDQSSLLAGGDAVRLSKSAVPRFEVNWDSQRPIQSFKDQLAVLSENSRFIPSGSMLSSLTYYATIAIIETDKLGHCSEDLKDKLLRCGWSKSKYAFEEVPDMDKLVQLL